MSGVREWSVASRTGSKWGRKIAWAERGRFDVALFVLCPKGAREIARGFQPLGPELKRGPGLEAPGY